MAKIGPYRFLSAGANPEEGMECITNRSIPMPNVK